MLVARNCLDIDQSTVLRSKHQAEHSAHLRGDAVEIYAAGPLYVDGRDEPVGSLHVLDVSTLQQAQKFHDDDPYTPAGILAIVTIARWDKRLGRA